MAYPSATSGPTRVTVEGLRLAPDAPRTSKLSWSLLPSEWPDNPQEEGPWNNAILDESSEPLPLERVRRLLRIFRIAGDESLAQSLASQIHADRLRLQALTNRVENRRVSWDGRLSLIEGLTGDSSEQSMASREADLSHLEELVADLESQLNHATEHRKHLAQISSLLSHREALSEKLPSVLTERDELQKTQNSLIKELEVIDQEAAKLRSQAEKSEETAAQLTYLEGLYRKRRQRLGRRMREVNRLSADLALSGTLTEESVAALERETERQLSSARRRRRTHDRAGMLLDLADDLQTSLERARGEELEDEVIARVSRNSFTVQQLDKAVGRRRDELIEEVDSAGQELQEEIAGLQRRADLLATLSKEVRYLHNAENDVASAEAEIQSLVGELSAAAADAYRELVERRTSILDKLVEISAQIGELERERTMLEAEGNLQEVNGKLGELGASQSNLEEVAQEIRNVEAQVAKISNDLTQARYRFDQAKTSLQGQYANVQSGVDRLLHDRQFDWLERASIDVPAEDEDVHVQAHGLDNLRLAARKVSQEMAAASNDLLALDKTMEALADRLNKEQPAIQAETLGFRFTGSVVRYYQRKFTEQLAAQEIREALFEGGSNLRLDLISMTTTWVTPRGERRTRPLEAFSSGERAFAYTRVQLEAIRSVAAVNKVAFLDEFGAYVARDRLEELISFIQRRALRDLVDQVVVILPLSSEMNPEESAELERRHYFARNMETEIHLAKTQSDN